MSRRKQKFNPIEYKEKPPAWMMIPDKPDKEETNGGDDIIDETVTCIESEDDSQPRTELIFVESEDGTESYLLEESEQPPPRVPKEKTKEFVRREMEKLCATLDELIDYDDHDFVVNFVLDMSGQAKKKTWEIQGYINK